MLVSVIYFVYLPGSVAAVAAADVEQPLGRFGDVAGDGVPALRPVTADCAGVALVIGQQVLQRRPLCHPTLRR